MFCFKMLFVEFFCVWKVHNNIFFCPVFFVYPSYPLLPLKLKLISEISLVVIACIFLLTLVLLITTTILQLLFFWEKRKLSIKILKWTFHLYILLLITFKKGVMPFVSEKCNMMPSPHSPISRHMFWKINEYTDILILLYILHFFWFTNIIARFWYLGISGICM